MFSQDGATVMSSIFLSCKEWNFLTNQSTSLSSVLESCGCHVMCGYLCAHLSDAASKHAAQAFFDCLRAEVEEYGIVVSTISHTFINASEPTPVKEATSKPNSLSTCK